ncbi:MAG: TonB-dependent receptor [Bacteroidetes bacterium]|nr:TonB-dependent receptor [Bacteroidota bacterium]
MRFILVLISVHTFSMFVLSNDIDTNRTYLAHDVVVTATRLASSSADVAASVHILSGNILTRTPLPTLADILCTVEGVYVQNYGLTSGSKSISFRGFSPTNSLILYNGIPLNNPQYGGIDLATLPLQALDRVEIVHGGTSSLYGEHATGGVIHMVTRNPRKEFHSKAFIGGSSFLGRSYGVQAEGSIASFGLLGGVSYESGKDNYPYFIGTTELRRSNADYQRRHFFTTATFNGIEKVDIRTTAEFVNIEQGVPGSLSWLTPKARQHDKIFRAILNTRMTITDEMTLRADAYSITQTQNYREPSVWTPTDLTYETKQSGASILGEFSIRDNVRLLGGASINGCKLSSSGLSWGVPLTLKPTRTGTSFWIVTDYVHQTSSQVFDRTIFTLSSRYDSYSDINESALSPKIGITVRILRVYDFRVWASVGKNFRAPTFNDLYYPNYSNPSLNPERSTSYEVGVRSTLDGSGIHTVRANYFNSIVQNKIVLNPQWIPYNIGKAEHTGLELRYEYHAPSNTFDAYAGASFVDARKTYMVGNPDPSYGKKLPNVPLSTGVIGFTTSTILGTIAMNTVFTGKRYTDELNTAVLPAHAITDASYSTTFTVGFIKATFTFTLSNVFDVQYSIVNDYPMPGRTFKSLFTFEY